MTEIEGEQPSRENDPGIFQDEFPTPTAGDGKIVANNIRSGSSQGVGSFKRKVRCRQCGFVYDIQKNDHSGGDDTGNGAGGRVTTDGSSLTDDVTGEYRYISGDAAEHTGTQAYRKGAGCPLCFSKNGAAESISNRPAVRPINKPGF